VGRAIPTVRSANRRATAALSVTLRSGADHRKGSRPVPARESEIGGTHLR
jgi:hypothetical protein